MHHKIDEETPLLRDQSRNAQQANPEKPRTPLPWRQFSILLLVQISEPLTFQVIAPFLPQLIGDIGITEGNDARIGYYVGLLHSLFFMAEACTIFHWSRMSDQIGRRPVILLGLFGLSVSMWCFGLSKTFWGLVLSRCLSGALNGNIGVMKSTIVEITDETNVAQAFGISPIAWSFGATIGPLIGGALARPAERFPALFGNSAFFNEYPYFLPSAVAAAVSALLWLTVFLFLKETSHSPMSLKQYFLGWRSKKCIGDGSEALWVNEGVQKQLPFRSLLVRPVLVATGSYAAFSLVDIAFRAVLPVFYAMPIEMGGLGLDPPTIGITLAVLGVLGAIIQVMFFAPMFNWLGAKLTFIVCVSLSLPMIAMFPVMSAAAREYGLNSFVWLLVGIQLGMYIITDFTFSVTAVYLGAAAPDKASIGATNGFAQTIVSVMRAVGPATVNSAFSFGIEEHIMGGQLVYVVMAAMVALTLWIGLLLPRTVVKNY